MLCYLDLDRFKVVNDTSGHLAGDSMLREVAKLLQRCGARLRHRRRASAATSSACCWSAARSRRRGRSPTTSCRAVADYRFVWKDKIFNIGVSVGLVEISRESGTLEELLAPRIPPATSRRSRARHVHVYSARDEALARHSGEIQWLQRLQAALKENRFELYYQPIVPPTAPDGDGPGDGSAGAAAGRERPAASRRRSSCAPPSAIG